MHGSVRDVQKGEKTGRGGGYKRSSQEGEAERSEAVRKNAGQKGWLAWVRGRAARETCKRRQREARQKEQWKTLWGLAECGCQKGNTLIDGESAGVDSEKGSV